MTPCVHFSRFTVYKIGRRYISCPIIRPSRREQSSRSGQIIGTTSIEKRSLPVQHDPAWGSENLSDEKHSKLGSGYIFNQKQIGRRWKFIIHCYGFFTWLSSSLEIWQFGLDKILTKCLAWGGGKWKKGFPKKWADFHA